MRMHPFHRTELLVGGEGFARLKEARVCVVGLGGVGSYAAEAVARSGVGHLTIVDFDRVCVTNINRQLPATRKTTGQLKAELVGERIRSINPKADVRVMATFFDSTTSASILDDGYDVVLDCIDNMTAKLHLLESCHAREIPVIAAMGAGGRLDPTRVQVSDISNTELIPSLELSAMSFVSVASLQAFGAFGPMSPERLVQARTRRISVHLSRDG